MNQSIYDLMGRAERILNEWLVDNTEDVFEEQPEIDEARALLIEAMTLAKATGEANEASQTPA